MEIKFYEIEAVSGFVTICVPGKKEIYFASIENIIFAKDEAIKVRLNEWVVKG